MQKFLTLLGILVLCALPAAAQVPMTGAGLGVPAVSGGSFMLVNTGSFMLVNTGSKLKVQ